MSKAQVISYAFNFCSSSVLNFTKSSKQRDKKKKIVQNFGTYFIMFLTATSVISISNEFLSMFVWKDIYFQHENNKFTTRSIQKKLT